MENTKIDKIIDIRQSEEWGEYLKTLGWVKHSIGKFKNFYSLKAGPMMIAKMQRPDNLNEDDLVQLDELAAKNRLSFLKVEPALNQSLDSLSGSKYILSSSPLCPPSTIFIDLQQDEDNLRSKLSKTARYSTNRSKREGGTVEVYSTPDIKLLQKIHPILEDTAKLQHFFAPSFKDLQIRQELWQEHCHIALVKNAQGNICGTNFFLGFNGNAWHIHGGTTAEGRKTKLGYLLLWESILYLKSKGYNYLDLEGKDDKRFPSFTKNWGGFSYFKEKFGGMEINFPYPQIKFYSKPLRFLSRIYKSALPL